MWQFQNSLAFGGDTKQWIVCVCLFVRLTVDKRGETVKPTSAAEEITYRGKTGKRKERIFERSDRGGDD